MSSEPSVHWTALVEQAQKYSPAYHIAPQHINRSLEWESGVRVAVHDPTDMPSLDSCVDQHSDIVILVDDGTRPTPQHEILPALLDSLNDAGVCDNQISVLIALGTHRYMTRAEMRKRFGQEVCGRVDVKNHTWRDKASLQSVGQLSDSGKLILNRSALEADFLIGVGSIVPHIWAGWGGGAKILLPGISAAESIAPTHGMAENEGDLLQISGHAENSCRREIEQAAEQAGLNMILNCVLDADMKPVWIGAGEPVKTHRKGVSAAKKVFVKSIPGQTDIVLADARPAVKDYWQGVKALAHSTRGVREGGVIVFTGPFPQSVSSTHPEFSQHAACSPDEINDRHQKGEIQDAVIVTTLKLHASICQRYKVVCLSEGLAPADKRALGFHHADDAADALDQATSMTSPAPSVGIIDNAANVLACE